MSQKITVSKVTEQPDLEKVFAIRYEVFVIEQRCPPELEMEFNREANHFLATIDGIPAGASRWRKTDKGYKLERFAVLKDFRGAGIGQALVKGVLNDLPKDADYIYLHSQTQAVALYKKVGFEINGPEFEEAGIRHYKMLLKH